MSVGKRVYNQETLKVLGFTFGSRPNCDAYIDLLKDKFRKRICIIRHLKKSGLPPSDLLAMYRCFILPVLDYACPVYHSMITNEQKLSLENLQSRSLKRIRIRKILCGTA